MQKHTARGQALIIMAIVTSVAVVAVIVFISLATLYATRQHARQSLQVACAGGARELDFSKLSQGILYINPEQGLRTTRETFANALATRPNSLGADPATIAGSFDIRVFNATPWTSPFSGDTHAQPGIAATGYIPINVLIFPVQIPITVETETSTP